MEGYDNGSLGLSRQSEASRSFCVAHDSGCAIAHAVSRRLPSAAARVRDQIRSCICGGQGGTGAGILLVLRFPISIFITPTAPQLSSGAGVLNILGRGRALLSDGDTELLRDSVFNIQWKQKSP